MALQFIEVVIQLKLTTLQQVIKNKKQTPPISFGGISFTTLPFVS